MLSLKPARRGLLPALLGGLLLSAAAGAAPTPRPEQARRADDFVDAIGIGARLGTGGLYDDFPKVSAVLAGLGVRHLRFGAGDQLSFDRVNALYARYGIRDLFGTGTSSGTPPAEVVARMHKMPGAIDAVEGPNEIDIKQWDDATHGFNKWFTYNGLVNSETDLGASRTYMSDVADALKADPATRTLQTAGPSCAFPENAKYLAPLTKNSYLNMHAYAGGALPDDQLDTRWIPNTEAQVGPGSSPKPILATEGGYHTALGDTRDQPGVSERAQGKYFPRLFAEYFNRGISRLYTYELADHDSSNPNDEQMNFGIVHTDGTPKPAYTAEKTLIGLLNESHWDPATKTWKKKPFRPRTLTYALSGPDLSSVRHVLLQKATGEFDLLLWQNVSVFDKTAKKDLSNPDVPVTLTLGGPIHAASLLRLTPDARPSPLAVSHQAIRVSVPDEVVIVRIVPTRRGSALLK